MNDREKTREELLYELEIIKRRNRELEKAVKEGENAASALKVSEKKYRDMIETSNEGIWIIDRDAYTAFANEKMADILGRTVGEMIGRHLFDFMDEEAAQEATFRFERLRAGEKAVHDFRFRKKDGSSVWTIISTSPLLNDHGEFVGALGMFTDVNERVEAERALRKAKDEIEEWNRELETRVREKTEELMSAQDRLIQSAKLAAMGEMAGGLAHELNSPLAGLLPMVEKYRDDAEKDSAEYVELSLMYNACVHMAKIVKDFGSFSRESKGNFINLDINEVIENTLSFSLSRFKQKNVHLIKEFESGIYEIMGEKTELQQVVLNIVVNALDAMPSRGKLLIKTGMTEDGRHVVMSFEDNGCGIEHEHLDRIFDPFFTTKRPGKGTGLGLSVSYRIIEKHGGKIEVNSAPCDGTIFTVYLPVV